MNDFASDPTTFSLSRGGPTYRALHRLRLVRHDRYDPLRLASAIVLVAWLPLVITGALSWWRGRELPALLLDFSVHARLLVALPLYAVAERWVDILTPRCLNRLITASFSKDADAVGRAVANVARLRDSVVVELLLAALAVSGGLGVLVGLTPTPGFVRSVAADSGSMTRVWYTLCALPLYQFATMRWAWRWALWSWLLWRVSRIGMRPEPAHPDLQGGLGFLAEPANGLMPLFGGLASVLAGAWGSQVAYAGAHATQFRDELALVIVVALLIAFGPLFSFTGQMLRAQLHAKREYARLALDFTRLFNTIWLETPGQVRPETLGNGQIEAADSLGALFARVSKMRPVPFGARQMIRISAAILAPMLPLVLTEVPLSEVVRRLGSVLLGVG